MKQHDVARELVTQLSGAGLDARATGAGVHWHVDVEPVGGRSLRVHCFWYERAIAGLMAGMSPANTRSSLRARPAPYHGPEYLVMLHDESGRVADGRARNVAEVVAGARAWVEGATREEMVSLAPFIDEKGRAMRSLATRLGGELRWELGGDPSYELWVYGEGRSCMLASGEQGLSCSFLLGQAQVAHAFALDEAPVTVRNWLIDKPSVFALARSVAGVKLERHAEVLETDPARWHWLHVRDRIEDVDDVLAPLKPLLEALADSPVATRFYSFSSLFWLCFSASSHYPWVNEGLPVVARSSDGAYQISTHRDGRQDGPALSLSDAIHRIESVLASYPITPFFGSAPHHDLPMLAEGLARQGSSLSPRLEQHQASFRLVVGDGQRRCLVDGTSVTFLDGGRRATESWPSLDEAVSAIRSYLEQGLSPRARPNPM